MPLRAEPLRAGVRRSVDGLRRRVDQSVAALKGVQMGGKNGCAASWVVVWSAASMWRWTSLRMTLQ